MSDTLRYVLCDIDAYARDYKGYLDANRIGLLLSRGTVMTVYGSHHGVHRDITLIK